MDLLCKYYIDLVKELHEMSVPFDDASRTGAWRDFSSLPLASHSGSMHKAMNYMKLLIRRLTKRDDREEEP